MRNGKPWLRTSILHWRNLFPTPESGHSEPQAPRLCRFRVNLHRIDRGEAGTHVRYASKTDRNLREERRQTQKVAIELSAYLSNARSKLSETVKPALGCGSPVSMRLREELQWNVCRPIAATS
jgi:hypothetical protein